MSDTINILMCTLAFDLSCIMFKDVAAQTRFDLEKLIANRVLFTKPSGSLPYLHKPSLILMLRQMDPVYTITSLMFKIISRNA